MGGNKRKQGKSVKAARKNQLKPEDEYSTAPHTFIFHRGVIGSTSRQLMKDLRKVLEPYTARSLKAQSTNSLKDFVTVAGPLGVHHFVIFSKTDIGNNMRIMRLSRGPTMTFRILEFVLATDVAASIKKQSMYARQFMQHPLLVLNNFSKEGLHLKLMATMFQNMFPSIDVNKVKVNAIRRCVLLNYDPDTETIDFRHYSIKVVPMGLSKSAKKLINPKVPSLQNYQDVSDFFLNAGYLSESEAELDGEHNEVTLPQRIASRGNISTEKSAIRLIEIGPRMTLELLKIEEGMNEGEVLHHKFITKSSIQLAKLRERSLTRKKVKVSRKKHQEQNVNRKMEEKELHKQKSLSGMSKKQDQPREIKETNIKFEKLPEDVEDDDDTEYYRQEVGEEPDPDLFPKKTPTIDGSSTERRKRGHPGSRGRDWKRPKTNNNEDSNHARARGDQGGFSAKFVRGSSRGAGKAFRKAGPGADRKDGKKGSKGPGFTVGRKGGVRDFKGKGFTTTVKGGRRGFKGSDDSRKGGKREFKGAGGSSHYAKAKSKFAKR